MSINKSYYDKYIKYKLKYDNLKKHFGGDAYWCMRFREDFNEPAVHLLFRYIYINLCVIFVDKDYEFDKPMQPVITAYNVTYNKIYTLREIEPTKIKQVLSTEEFENLSETIKQINSKDELTLEQKCEMLFLDKEKMGKGKYIVEQLIN